MPITKLLDQQDLPASFGLHPVVAIGLLVLLEDVQHHRWH